jgi:hypothetical protein
MDQVQILACNINHMYNHDATLQDFYYRSPFLLFFSTIIVFINCKLFGYNTFFENITSGVILFLIARYYIIANKNNFSNRNKLYFSTIAALIIFCLSKWEMSSWGGGFSHYIVVFFGFICINIAHKYYILKETQTPGNRYFITIYILLSVVAALETTSYFLPFQLSILILLFVNYKLFRTQINLKKWRVVFGVTISLLFFSVLINYLAEVYSMHHPYDGYGKVNLGNNIGASFQKIVTDPMFVVKFFFVANAGSLVDKDFYGAASFAKNSMPFIGFIIFLYYCYAVYLFVKRKKTEGIFPISLILYSAIFSATVLVGRLGFNDVYFGASSRYSAATFSGLLGVATFFMILIQGKGINNFGKLIYLFPLLLISFCSLVANKNEWTMAPYRKESFLKMADNLKANQNLESLYGYNNEMTGKARDMMIKNKLNVFKPQTKLNEFTLNSNLSGLSTFGFYNLESGPNGTFRWTNGEGVILLPNLYTSKDTIKVRLKCYVPHQPDTPKIVLNDNLIPFRTAAIEGGYEYYFSFQEQKVLFKILLQSKNTIPAEVDLNSSDKRKLGIIFNTLNFYE